MNSSRFFFAMFFLSIIALGISWHVRETRKTILSQLEKAEIQDLYSVIAYQEPVKNNSDKTMPPNHSKTTSRAAETLGSLRPQKATSATIDISSNRSAEKKINFESVIHQYCELGEASACEVKEKGKTSLYHRFYQCRIYGTGCMAMASALEKIGDFENSILALKSDCQINDSSESCLRTSQRMIAREFPEREIQEVLSIACDQNNATACLNLADLYLEMGYQRLYDQHYKKACSLDFSAANCSQFK